MDITQAVKMASAELESATKKFGPFNSYHEGYAVIKEEFEELWDEIKKRDRDQYKLRLEAIQLAAMALRFLVDIEHMARDRNEKAAVSFAERTIQDVAKLHAAATRNAESGSPLRYGPTTRPFDFNLEEIVQPL
jgi:hypothetical protein